MPGGAKISGWHDGAATSISISLSSSSPSRSFLRNFCRVAAIFGRLQRRLPTGRAGGSSTSSTRSSAASMARSRTMRMACSRPFLIGDLGQVADDGVDVAADVADLGELGRLDLDEGRVGQPRQAARDLGLADAGGADHQDVLRRDLGAQRLGHLRARQRLRRAMATAAWRALADDVLVEFGDDFLRGHPTCSFQHLDGVVLVGVDAQVAGDASDFLTISAGVELGVLAARAPPTARRRRRCRWRRCRVRARARRRCR
jgi:hypothetical protein